MRALFGADSGVAPAATGASSEPAHNSPFRRVVSTPYPSLSVVALAGGAIIADHSLLLVIYGDEAKQDAAWLTGLPEIVNWDASVFLDLPPKARLTGASLPPGMGFGVHAGNLHGPSEDRVWNGRGWARQARAGDPRLRPYNTNFETPAASQQLASGELAVLRTATGSVDVVIVSASGAKTGTSPPIPVQTDWVRGSFVGHGSADLRVCLGHGVILARQPSGAWSEIPPPGGSIESCALTDDGVLWAVHGGSPNRLSRLRGSDWEPVALPSTEQPQAVRAAERRVWVVTTASQGTGSSVWSTEPVREPLTISAAELPGELYFGISGLDDTGPEVPSVSADPPGPGSSACSSLLLYLGKAPVPELRAVLDAREETSTLDLYEADGQRASKLVASAGAGTELALSRGVAPARYLVVPSFAVGKRAVELLRGALPAPKPSLICARPRRPRRLPR